ncbi:nucleotide disphospho-sugar-binding domain-containing protein [Kitasatospora sp. NPDC088134]|uniref:nucleotide disphospho-sugar-binding domain-containing protein n=1 Tax=Kitasatospora sp. NPDC088134 TaxID=3364071 RepID=UPI00381CA56F
MRIALNALIASHFTLMAPFAWALRAAGHDVLVVGGADVAAAARDAGLTARAVDPATRRLESGTAAPAAPVPAAPGADPAGGSAREQLLRRKAPQLRLAAAGLAEELGAWRPDLVITDPLGYAARVAAAVLGVPVAVHRWGIQEPHGETEEAARRVFGPLCAELGGPAGLPEPLLTLDPCPPALRVPGTEPAEPVRHQPTPGRYEVPDWALAAPAGERVCVLLGVWGARLLAEGGRLADTVAAIAAAVAGPGREVLVLLPPEHHLGLGELPAGVRVHGPLPLDLVLPGSVAVVHHGGNGTALAAVARGVPQLVLPAERPELAVFGQQVAAAGVGRLLTAADGDPLAALPAALAEVIADPAYRKAAEAVGAEVAAMPAPAELVPLLERLVRSAA